MPKYIFVPCGECEDCKRNIQNEWFFRAYNEYIRFIELGGVCYIPTLTYNQEDLPVVCLDIRNDSDLGFCGDLSVDLPCFCHADIRSFIRKLRVYVERLGYDSHGIKYIVCCEFGDKKGRPHYHCAIFFPFRFSPMDVPNDSIALKLFRRAWIHGFVGVGRKGIRVNGIAGIRYAMKYITKDMSFFNQKQKYVKDGVVKIFDLKEWLNVEDDVERKVRKNSLRFVAPRHWQSIRFGIGFLDTLKHVSEENLVQMFVDNKYRLLTASDGDFAIPRYYHTALERVKVDYIYNLLHRVSYVPTSFGVRVKLETMYKKFDTFVDELKGWNLQFVKTWLPESAKDVFGNFEEFSKKHSLSVAQYYADRVVLISNLPVLLKRVDLREFAYYYHVLRFVPCSPDETKESLFARLDDIMYNIACPSSIDSVYFTLFDVDDVENRCSTPLKYHRNLVHESCCADCHDFADFETLACLIDKFRYYMGLQKQNTSYRKNKKKKEDKQNNLKKGFHYEEYPSLTETK